MYAAIRKYRVKSGSMDEIVQRVDDQFLGIIGSSPGYVSYYLVVSDDTTLTTVSVFTDREGAEHSTELAASWVKENLQQYVEGAPEVTTGDVRVHGGP